MANNFLNVTCNNFGGARFHVFNRIFIFYFMNEKNKNSFFRLRFIFIAEIVYYNLKKNVSCNKMDKNFVYGA